MCDQAREKGLIKLPQNTPYHKIVHILSSVYNIYFLLILKCCLLNSSLMVKPLPQWFLRIISYDASNLKNIVKFFVPT